LGYPNLGPVLNAAEVAMVPALVLLLSMWWTLTKALALLLLALVGSAR
jgi:hypothetical protein